MEINKFAPVIELTYTDQADLAALVATPGYRVLHKIMRSEVDKFILSLINTKVEGQDKDAVYNKFLLSKAAAQFYQQVTDRINGETLQYVSSQDHRAPVDETEGILDLGERASTVADSLEEESIIE